MEVAELLDGYARGRRDFRGVVLRGLGCREAELPRVDLRGADLSGIDWSGADLADADLPGTVLRGANLFGANLRRVLLYWAVLFGVILSEACLGGATLRLLVWLRVRSESGLDGADRNVCPSGTDSNVCRGSPLLVALGRGGRLPLALPAPQLHHRERDEPGRGRRAGTPASFIHVLRMTQDRFPPPGQPLAPLIFKRYRQAHPARIFAVPLLGTLGLHRFYVGQPESGVAMLLLFVLGSPAVFFGIGFLTVFTVGL